MPVQRTFTLIAPGAGAAAAAAAAAQPMTSKQVRKAYQAATRSAPVSRPERLRQERAEQDRIRRELRRDRAAAARERKRGRDAGLREARRRRRLPLADVRPSQDTIAKFVRGAVAVQDAAVEALASGPDDVSRVSPAREPDVDLIPDEDELDLEALEQLDAVAAVHAQSHGPGPAQNKASAAASRRSSRPATPYELDLGLRQAVPDRTPPPPAATQAILCNLDDFFPSSSQQERELREETAADAPPPRFTPSGVRELVALALQRSRRSAALEQLQQRRATPPSPPVKPARGRPSPPTRPLPAPDKENVAPPPDAGPGARDAPPASQESEYGGDWVDEIAVDFTI